MIKRADIDVMDHDDDHESWHRCDGYDGSWWSRAKVEMQGVMIIDSWTGYYGSWCSRADIDAIDDDDDHESWGRCDGSWWLSAEVDMMGHDDQVLR